MDTRQISRPAGSEPTTSVSLSDEPARGRRSVWSVLNLNSLIYAYGSWSLGFWLSLTFGLGWYFAVVFAVGFGAVVFWLARRWAVARVETATEWPDAVPLTVLLGVVLVWPVAFELDRSALIAIAVGLLVLRAIVPFIRRNVATTDARLFALTAIAIGAAAAYWVSWALFVVGICLLALAAVVRPKLLDALSRSAQPAVSRSVEAKVVANAVLVVLGLLISVWWVAPAFWSSDNTYYLNKAAHYADSTTSFEVHDYMYGFDDAQHYPMGDVLSSFEPLVGVSSAVSGAAPASLLFRLFVPLATFLVPFAARSGARGLGVRRSNLVGGVAAAVVLLMTGVNTSSLFATASQGKTIGAIVAIPILIGCMGALLRDKGRGAALRATMAVVCAVALSPTLALASFVIVVPFTIAALWDLRPRRREELRERWPSLLAVAAPALLLGVYALTSRVLQQRAGSSQLIGGFLAKSPKQAWERAFTGERGEFLTYVFVVGSIVLLPLVLRSLRLRRAIGLLILIFFGLVFSPWFYDAIVDRLPDLHYFAWRIPWALPAALFIGIALATIDQRRTLGLLTLVAALIGMGLSGPDLTKSFFPVSADLRRTPVWPWERGVPEPMEQAADTVARATPTGQRFLAPPKVEEIATALHTDKFPVYARLHYVTAVGTADHVPSKFFGPERLLLARGMTGAAKNADVEQFRSALDRVDVATVCTDKGTVASLREAVQSMYEPRGSAGACDLWTRGPRR